jgi:hypothetical protein
MATSGGKGIGMGELGGETGGDLIGDLPGDSGGDLRCGFGVDWTGGKKLGTATAGLVEASRIDV